MWGARRDTPLGVFGIIIAAVVLHVGLVTTYFFHDERFLLPILPLLILLAALGLGDLYRLHRLLGLAVGIYLLLTQLRLVSHTLRPSPPAVLVGEALRRVEPYLPREGLVVSDVAAPLAWLYWTRNTDREFMPVTIPPARFGDDVFLDRHLRRLYWNAATGNDLDLPPIFLDQGIITRAGAEVTARHHGQLYMVLCTRYRHRLDGILLHNVRIERKVSTPDCDILTIRAP